MVSLGFGISLPRGRRKPNKSGESNPRAKLTSEQVRDIWGQRFQVSGMVLAKKHKALPSTISRIWHRTAWKTVTDEMTSHDGEGKS